MKYALLLLVVALWGCGSEPPADVDKGPKLTAEQAQQYKGLIPGNRKSDPGPEK